MVKLSRKHQKEFKKIKRMLGIKGIKGSHIILGAIALGVVYFVFVKGKGLGGGGTKMMPAVVNQGGGSYIVPPLPENLTNIIDPHELGPSPVGKDVHPPGAYDVYSGAVGDVQYVPSTADIVPMRRQSEEPYEMGFTYQPY